MTHRTLQGEIITDDMKADEIIGIIRSDLDENFHISLVRRLAKATKKIRKYYIDNDKMPDEPCITEMIGKSGQRYKFATKASIVGKFVSLNYKILMYFTVRTKYDVMYYTVSIDDGDDIFEASPDKLHINRFTSHVVHRYVERCKGTKYGEAGFIDMNFDNRMIDPVEDENGSLVAITDHGSFVGKIIDGKQCYNTFYSDSITKDHRSMRKILKDTCLRDDTTHYRKKDVIDFYIALFKIKSITAQELISFVNTELENADDNFYKFFGCTPETFRQHIGDTIRSSETHRNTRFERTKSKLCVGTCIPRSPF